MKYGESTHHLILDTPVPVQVLQRWIAPYISRRPLLDNLLKPSPTPYHGTCDHLGFAIERRLPYRARAPMARGTFRPTPSGTIVYINVQQPLFGFVLRPVALGLLGSLAIALGAALISLGQAPLLIIPAALLFVPVGVAAITVGHNHAYARQSIADLRRMLTGHPPVGFVSPTAQKDTSPPEPLTWPGGKQTGTGNGIDRGERPGGHHHAQPSRSAQRLERCSKPRLGRRPAVDG